jgi:hypothetical protein
MSYRLKGKNIIFDGDRTKFIPKSLPAEPEQYEIIVDIADNKLKTWDGSRWIVLGDAIDIFFDNSTNGFVANTVQEAIEELAENGITIDALTEFEAFDSPNQESTTSSTPQIKTGYPYTTDTKSAGSYVINYTAQISQGSDNKVSRLIIEWRLGTSGTWQEILDTKQELRANGFVPWSGFSVVDLPNDSQFQVRISYANPGAGSCIIKEANITIGKVAD